MQRALSIVVPVYNRGPILPDLVLRLEPVLRPLFQRFELVLVDTEASVPRMGRMPGWSARFAAPLLDLDSLSAAALRRSSRHG